MVHQQMVVKLGSSVPLQGKRNWRLRTHPEGHASIKANTRTLKQLAITARKDFQDGTRSIFPLIFSDLDSANQRKGENPSRSGAPVINLAADMPLINPNISKR